MASLSPVSVVALRPLVCGAVTWRSLGVLRVTVIVKATFGLVNGGDARLVAPQPLNVKDRPRGGRADASLEHASDLAPFLPNASFTVNATAHAPGNTPTSQMSASIAIHRERPVLEKTIYVYGDRRDGATTPLPFSSMPIVYERTYGGGGVAENPVGVGAAPGDRAPNLVDPNDPRGPAGFGPIASTWAPRARMVLPKDRERLESDPMELPSTVDFRLFSAAPADQHLPYLRGDEWITLDGMHATYARFSTRLPSVTAAARWSIPSRGEPPTHLELVADTLHLDVDRQTGHVVWRGHFVIDSLDVVPLLHVETAVEMPGYAVPWPAVVHDEATAALDTADVVDLPAIAGPATEDEGTSIIELPGTRAPLPFAPGPAAPALAQAAASSYPWQEVPALRETSSEVMSPFARPTGAALPFASPALGDSLAPGATVTNQISPFARPVMPFASSVPSAQAARPAAPIPGAPWSGEQPARAPAVQSDEGSTMLINLASLREPTLEGDGAAAVTPPAALPFAAQAPAPPLAAAMPFVSAPPLMPSAPSLMPSAPPLMPSAPSLMPSAPSLVAAPPSAVSAPPRAETPPAPPALFGEPKGLADAAPRRPEPEPETEAAPDAGDVTAFAAVRAELVARVRASRSAADLALAGANLSSLDLKGADLKGANLAGATLVRTNLDGAILSGANLSGANLAGASLKAADLERADFSRATLSGARLEGARVAGAMFGEAKGARANFKGAKGARPNLSKGTWDRAVFCEVELFGADFGGSSLANADFSGAALEGGRFDDARARGAKFDGARAGQLRANGADFEGASFEKVEAAGSLWERANVGKACFRGAALRGATLARATADAAIFDGADLEGASFQRATAHGASFAAAKLDGADLRQARANDAVFEGAKLKRATGAKAELGGSRFDKAELDGANLREAKLKKASFLGAKLDGADLRDTDLDGADLRGASQKGTKLAGATKVGALEGDAPVG